MRTKSVHSRRTVLSFIVVLTLCLTMTITSGPQVHAAASYYVDGTNGNDINNGTSLSTAFKTISKAASKMVAGDTCYIRGEYIGKQLHL